MNTWRTVEVPAPEHTEGCSAGQCCCDEGLACCVLTEAAECVCGGVCTRLTDGDGMEDVDLVAGSGGDRAGRSTGRVISHFTTQKAWGEQAI